LVGGFEYYEITIVEGLDMNITLGFASTNVKKSKAVGIQKESVGIELGTGIFRFWFHFF